MIYKILILFSYIFFSIIYVNAVPVDSLHRPKKIAICIMLKGMYWSSKPIFTASAGSLVYFPKNFPYSKEDMLDSMDWSFTWFDYKF